MKKHLLLWLLNRRHHSLGRWKNGVLIALGLFSVVTIAGLILTGVLVFQAGGVLVDQATKLSSAWVSTSPLDQAGRQVERSLQSCPTALKGLLSFEPWLNVPLAQTFKSVRAACFPEPASEPLNEHGSPKTLPEGVRV